MDLMKKQDQSFRREKRDHIPAVYFKPDDPFPFKENYGDYIDLTKSGYCEINTSVLNIKNWKYHLDSIINNCSIGFEYPSGKISTIDPLLENWPVFTVVNTGS